MHCPPAMTRRLLSLAALVMCTSAVSIAQSTPSTPSANTPANTLTAAEKQAGWTLLFDGRSLAAWRVVRVAPQKLGER